MSSFFIYTILMLDNLRDALTVVSVFSYVTASMCAIVMLVCHIEGLAEHRGRRLVRRFLFGSILVAVLVTPALVLVPSTKQAVIVYTVPKIVDNEQVQKIPENFIKHTNDWLEKQLHERVKGKMDDKK